MTDREIWRTMKRQMDCDEIVLDKRLSYIGKHGLTGMINMLARYKFAMRMMQNRKRLRVIDFGSNEGVGCLLLKQNLDTESILGVDFDSDAIQWAKKNIEDDIIRFQEADFLDMDWGGYNADCVVSLDVIEHISQDKEGIYRDAVYTSLNDNGVAIIGTPNVTLYPYASEDTKKAHINNYDQKRLYELFAEKFSNVFIFGMNDEVVNTGFYPFSCYVFALCCK